MTFSPALSRYLSFADTHPVLFNMVNAATLFGLGDYIQQKMDINKRFLGKESKNHEEDGYNYFQTFKMMSYACLISPFNHLFYTRLLPRLVPTSASPTSKELFNKVFVDYVLHSPS